VKSAVTKVTATTRSGTAKHHGGKATAAKIVAAAREVLQNKGYAHFSMRKIATTAGLHLANVQYYYPTKDDLVRALFLDTANRYRDLYEERMKDAGSDPILRFERLIYANFDDILNKKTRQYFIQFWALLDELDNHSGRLLGELYALDIGILGDVIQSMHPDVDKDEIERRATLLAAMIEGLMVVRGAGTRRSVKVNQLLDRAYKTTLAIANGDI